MDTKDDFKDLISGMTCLRQSLRISSKLFNPQQDGAKNTKGPQKLILIDFRFDPQNKENSLLILFSVV